MNSRPFRAVLAALLISAAVVVPAGATAPRESAVATWNRLAVTALLNPVSPTVPGQLPGAGQPPTVAVLHLAMVQGAVYDAVNSIRGNREPYLSGIDSAPANANRRAAVASAAYHVLVGLQAQALPQVVRDRLAADYAAFLARIPNSPRKTAGIAAGADAAAAMLAERVDDGRYPATPVQFPIGMDAGQWRPGATGSDPFAWVANVDPFVVNSNSQFRSDGPLALTSARYAAEYNEVKALGEKDESTRTARQTAMANFFVANPVEMYNRNFRTVAADRGLSLAAEARLFAAVNLAGADALITCWGDKFFYPFWRPQTAIQNGNFDGNPATAGDADWEPLVPNPPYPDHPSGYNCVTGGMMHAAAGFFGTNRVAIDLVHANGTVRHYSRLSGVVSDTIKARMYLGIHFRTPDVQGAEIGRDVARWLTARELRVAD